ncbi:hypothetical protein BRE01_42450 [Brevibacillus reuszeri]|uniref:Uncharacterized protein n=1 Tax=Brevibacillus reuszeri TaxID=54915 RepID=A0A0K9YVY1_9BACL|nr:hypothetical protein [Brevibacillus reuszeri]KNB72395.1 hypothetical protein ADS79_10995 [Brevibacillus reuszeri]MED1860942.1 hypothetical protein [Brevibacillus reuszeri]GED70543.1 hypothetical protein BRE01_42450 [Brevibacillus reuszeri]
MKKWVVSALLVCMATGTLLSGVATPVLGAVTTSETKQNSQHFKPAQQPIHEKIGFNNVQVVGVDANGWNWVKNDEFILPPGTPLDIDLVQTTYGNGANLSRYEILLDNVAMPTLTGEKRAEEAVLRWEVPRISIPESQLPAGVHTLTFVMSDVKGQKSTVHVRFQVAARSTDFSVFEGEKAEGEAIPSDGVMGIFALHGTKIFTSTVTGTWTLYNVEKDTKKEMKSFSGKTYKAGPIMEGQYEVVFTPEEVNLPSWTTTIHVGSVDLYQGRDANGQKLTPNQKITAPAAPSQIQLYSLFPGRWWVNGTGQTLTDSQYFDVVVPDTFAGMALTVTFEPISSKSSPGTSRSEVASVQIQIPGTPNACGPTEPKVTLDLLTQKNKGSSLIAEKENLYSSNSTVTVYQKPIHVFWLSTAADHFLQGSEVPSDEGPGVWAVNNAIVENSKLNWDHTALDLSTFKPERYKINYYSKRDPKQTWCGYVQVIEDNAPARSGLVCDQMESGVAPPSKPISLKTKGGSKYSNEEKIMIESSMDLDEWQKVTLLASYVERTGTKKIKQDGRNYYMPKVEWSYGEIGFGSRQAPNGAQMTSENRVEVLYDGKLIYSLKPSLREDEDNGLSDLNIKKIISGNDAKPGEYTIRVTNTLGYTSCQILSTNRSYNKQTDFVESDELLTLTIDVQ